MDSGDVGEVLKQYLKPFSEAFDSEIKLEFGYQYYVDAGGLRITAYTNPICYTREDFYYINLEIKSSLAHKTMIIMQPYYKPALGVSELFCSMIQGFYEEEENRKNSQ